MLWVAITLWIDVYNYATRITKPIKNRLQHESYILINNTVNIMCRERVQIVYQLQYILVAFIDFLQFIFYKIHTAFRVLWPW